MPSCDSIMLGIGERGRGWWGLGVAYVVMIAGVASHVESIVLESFTLYARLKADPRHALFLGKQRPDN